MYLGSFPLCTGAQVFAGAGKSQRSSLDVVPQVPLPGSPTGMELIKHAMLTG